MATARTKMIREYGPAALAPDLDVIHEEPLARTLVVVHNTGTANRYRSRERGLTRRQAREMRRQWAKSAANNPVVLDDVKEV
jgi:hypothetical protein